MSSDIKTKHVPTHIDCEGLHSCQEVDSLSNAYDAQRLVIDNQKEMIKELVDALQFCLDYDRSPEPKYGEIVRGHIPPEKGSRFLTPRQKAGLTLSSYRSKAENLL